MFEIFLKTYFHCDNYIFTKEVERIRNLNSTCFCVHWSCNSVIVEFRQKYFMCKRCVTTNWCHTMKIHVLVERFREGVAYVYDVKESEEQCDIQICCETLSYTLTYHRSCEDLWGLNNGIFYKDKYITPM